MILGGVRRIASGRWHGRTLSPGLSGGYHLVFPCVGGKGTTRKVHQLVAEAFLGPRPTDKHEVNHRNGNKSDNRVENLEWVTRSQNVLHAHATGLIKNKAVGERVGRAKLTAEGVKEMRRLHADGVGFRTLGRRFGVDHKTAAAAICGKTWRWF